MSLGKHFLTKIGVGVIVFFATVWLFSISEYAIFAEILIGGVYYWKRKTETASGFVVGLDMALVWLSAKAVASGSLSLAFLIVTLITVLLVVVQEFRRVYIKSTEEIEPVSWVTYVLEDRHISYNMDRSEWKVYIPKEAKTYYTKTL